MNKNELRRTKEKLRVLKMEDLPIKQILFDYIDIVMAQYVEEYLLDVEVKEYYYDIMKTHYAATIERNTPPDNEQLKLI